MISKKLEKPGSFLVRTHILKSSILFIMLIFNMVSLPASENRCYRYDLHGYMAEVGLDESPQQTFVEKPVEWFYIKLFKKNDYNTTGGEAFALIDGDVYRVGISCEYEKGEPDIYGCGADCDHGGFLMNPKTHKIQIYRLGMDHYFDCDTGKYGGKISGGAAIDEIKKWLLPQKIDCATYENYRPKHSSQNLYVCYEEKTKNKKPQYKGCVRSKVTCKTIGKKHFGHYKNSCISANALWRCIDSTPYQEKGNE